MGFLGGLGGGGSLPPYIIPIRGEPGGGYNPVDQKMADKSNGGGTDWAALLGALGSLGGQQQTPQQPQPPAWMPMPQPRMLGSLQNAPQIGQRQMMGTPQQMAPYMWGGR